MLRIGEKDAPTAEMDVKTSRLEEADISRSSAQLQHRCIVLIRTRILTLSMATKNETSAAKRISSDMGTKI